KGGVRAEGDADGAGGEIDGREQAGAPLELHAVQGEVNLRPQRRAPLGEERQGLRHRRDRAVEEELPPAETNELRRRWVPFTTYLVGRDEFGVLLRLQLHRRAVGRRVEDQVERERDREAGLLERLHGDCTFRADGSLAPRADRVVGQGQAAVDDAAGEAY